MSQLRVDRLLEFSTRPSGWTILRGHGISAAPSPWHRHDPRHIPVDVFRRQMELLVSRGYEFISLADGLRLLRSGKFADRKVTLTFDDGFRNVVRLAYPVMRELELKGCLFVVAGLVGTDQLLWTDMVDVVCRWHAGRRLELDLPGGPAPFHLDDDDSVARTIGLIKRRLRRLPDAQRREHFRQIEALFEAVDPAFVPDDFHFANIGELKALDPAILEVGNHTMSHPELAQITDAHVLRCEIREAKAKLEFWLGRTVNHFCYPGGSYNAQTIDEVHRAGHLGAVAMSYGVNGSGTNRFQLNRLCLPADMPQFKCRLSGLEGRMLQLRSLAQHLQHGCGVSAAIFLGARAGKIGN